MSFSFNFFIVFHNEIYPGIYYISQEDKEHLTFYGVNFRQKTDYKIIYEDELPIYNPAYQLTKYNEASALWHIYANKLHESYDYIGFGQYDMKIYSHFFSTIKNIIALNPNTIFYVDRFEAGFVGGQTTITADFDRFEGGLKNYNAYFNTNFTKEDVNNGHLICYNSFIIPNEMYERMMKWMNQYYFDDLPVCMYSVEGDPFTPGHMIEALTGMFLGLETLRGAQYFRINNSLFHDPEYTLPKNYTLA